MESQAGTSLAGFTRLSREELPVSVGGDVRRLEAYVVDANFLEFFGIVLEAGSASGALARPNTAVLSKDTASRLFGVEDVIGRTFETNGQLVEVTGLIEHQQSSHLSPNLLISSSTDTTKLAAADSTSMSGEFFVHTYVRASEGASDLLKSSLGTLPGASFMPSPQAEALAPELELMPVADIHLNGMPAGELNQGGSKVLVAAIAAVGTVILLVACFNYSIMVAAESERRITEIGVRKAFGADARQIVSDFVKRGAIVTGSAICAALLLIILSAPLLSSQFGQQLTPSWPVDFIVILAVPAIALTISGWTLLASNAGAVNTKPVDAIRGETKRRGAFWRNAAAAMQFAVSIVLIVVTMVMSDQVRLARDETINTGDDDVLIVDGMGAPFPAASTYTLANIMKETPGVSAVSMSEIVPTDFSTTLIGIASPSTGRPEPIGVAANAVDSGFFATYGIQTIGGQVFRPGTEGGGANEIVLTSSAASTLGYENVDAVGKSVSMASADGLVPFTIIGVTADIPMKSIIGNTEPLAFTKLGERARYLSVRFGAAARADVVAALESAWPTLSEIPLDYFFLRERLAELYRPLDQAFRFFLGLAGTALAIAAFGVFGTATFAAERRQKEMGIRKALGASRWNVSTELLRMLTRPLSIGAVLAVPAAFIVSQWWLTGFAQRISLSPWPFLIAIVAAGAVGVFSMSLQTFRMAMTDPATVLRREQ
ncbi:hypothetical protein ASE94_01665 [Devosia sp. Leaf64]|nr:hypothetical protein ASE94_01665 [Devosia sp. Leaf64]